MRIKIRENSTVLLYVATYLVYMLLSMNCFVSRGIGTKGIPYVVSYFPAVAMSFALLKKDKSVRNVRRCISRGVSYRIAELEYVVNSLLVGGLICYLVYQNNISIVSSRECTYIISFFVIGFAEELYFRRILKHKMQFLFNSKIFFNVSANVILFSFAHIFSTELSVYGLVLKIAALSLVGVNYYAFYCITNRFGQTILIHAGYDIIINFSYILSAKIQIVYYIVFVIYGLILLIVYRNESGIESKPPAVLGEQGARKRCLK